MNIPHVLLSKYKLILLWGLVFAFVLAIVTLFLPKQYSAQADVLIIARDKTGTDAYTQAKSAERIGENLTRIIKTTDFYNKVISSSYNFNKTEWTQMDERKRRKKWDKDIQSSVMYGTGIMSITAYGDSKTDAVNLANALSSTISSHGWEYVGGDIVIKVVTKPLEPRFPSRPNFVVNILLGFLIGLLISSSWVIRYKKFHILG